MSIYAFAKQTAGNKFVHLRNFDYLCKPKRKSRKLAHMKRTTTILACLLCTMMMMGEGHLKFRTLPIDGKLKPALKEVRSWGFMGLKIKNMAFLMGTLDGQEVMVTLIATPKSNTLFSVGVMYDNVNSWEEEMIQYQAINTRLAAQYGEPSKRVQEFESPYSIANPIEAFAANKATYSTYYTAPGGSIAVDILYSEGKLSTMVAYVDEQNAALFKEEGGEDFFADESNIDMSVIENCITE